MRQITGLITNEKYPYAQKEKEAPFAYVITDVMIDAKKPTLVQRCKCRCAAVFCRCATIFNNDLVETIDSEH